MSDHEWVGYLMEVLSLAMDAGNMVIEVLCLRQVN